MIYDVIIVYVIVVTRARVHAYQANHECRCYNCYVSHHSTVLETCQRNVIEDMSQTIVSPSLIMKKEPTKHYQEEDFHLGIPGWCSCSNFASFSLDASPHLEAGSVETQCSKSSKQKRIEGCEAVKTTQQECNNNQTISDDINKPDIEAGKENIDNRFPFDTTIDELEKLMEGECPANTAKNTDWVYKNFESWCTARNQQFPEVRCPDDVFSSKEVAC